MQLRGKIPMEDSVIMEALSMKYGWTPKEIKEQSVADLELYLEILRIRNKLNGI